jgi:Tfp pilus assembly protein PilX
MKRTNRRLALSMAMALLGAGAMTLDTVRTANASSGTVGYHTPSTVECYDGGLIAVFAPGLNAANVTTAEDHQNVTWRSKLWQWKLTSTGAYGWVVVSTNAWLTPYVQNDSGSQTILLNNPITGYQGFNVTGNGYFRVSVDYYWYATSRAAAGRDSLWGNHLDQQSAGMVSATYCTYHA